MIIRREQPADHDAVRALHRAAFARDPLTGAVRAPADVPEARLVDELREDSGFLRHLSLVAVRDGVLAGHVMATRGWLEPTGAPALGLGPLGVLPAEQRNGVGSCLVHALLAVAEACDEGLVALLGAPGYYRRFGFRAAADLGVGAPDPRWGEHFQARQLTGRPSGGTFRYAEPFSRVGGPAAG
ncbi:GNAT family N-acetyltransferase [Blastococcus sp. TF02A-30]|uniref:GNAT family N-acetyltransferase n=1 Tax=Blastococcus sp. TF02A-30 TaxID=2250580 RepID=UPI000DE8450F|nr:N-acetyltransferase [Blastococcus sp. TF02A-30]RBY85485.1 GNAT family N-acetyltransferase [Blastococcus sp. TF02A-30]